MTNRIDETFSALKTKGEKVLIGYLTAGYPTQEAFERLVPALERSGVDILEIGIPFSDPIADGPTIQKASQVALQNGVTLEWSLDVAKRLRDKVRMPFIFMSYCNPIYAMGIETFFRRARECGVDGLIVPDLVPEVAQPYEAAANKEGVHLIYLAAPTTPSARLKQIASQTRGFLYIVSVMGVTGARREIPKELAAFVAKARIQSKVPLAVGFGISTPDQAREMGAMADGVIVGSALISAIEAARTPDFQEVRQLMAAFKKELRVAA